jgi:NhaP-type Na+/H+ or K+/H+ antiporter
MWEQTSVTKPHLAYMLLGGFITIFSLVSLFVKEKLYVGEATVATAFGIIMGYVAQIRSPHIRRPRCAPC